MKKGKPMDIKRLALVFAVLGLAAMGTAGQKESPKKKTESRDTKGSDFIRFRETGDKEGVLEAAVGRYENDQGVKVDLVAAVHIADKNYYEALNKRFKKYDVVLYEMIKPKGVNPAARRSGGALTFLQRPMENMLDLQFQLDAVDYSAKNFVHADMDPTTFSREQDLNDESIFKLVFRSVIKQWSRQMSSSKDSMSMGELFTALFSDDSSRALKYLFAREMKNVEEMLTELGGKKGTVLIEGRNKVAMKVLQDQIRAGKKTVAVFYGGGHMPDLEKRLRSELKMKKTGHEWLPAWDIRVAKKPAKAKKPKKALREL